MAFSSGTLLASGGDVLTQLMDAIRAFVSTAGWSENLYDDDSDDYGGGPYTGKRLHIQKTIDGTARFINLRSFEGQEVFSDTSTLVETGIAAIASTGYNVANAWDLQPGYTSDPINSAGNSLGCGAIDLPADAIAYWLFSQNSDDNIYLVCRNSTGYTGIMFGVTTTSNFFLSGSCVAASGATNSNALLTRLDRQGVLALRKVDDSLWWEWPNNQVGTSAVPLTHSTNSLSTFEEENSIAARLLQSSPDNFKGNNPLIPSYIGVVQGIFPARHQFAGTVEGVKYVNMKFLDSLTELTFSGDVYILFRMYAATDSNDATIGLAILK